MSHKDTVTQEQRWKISIQYGVSYVTETRTAEIFTKWNQHRDINVTQRYSPDRNKHGRLISDGSSYVTETRTAEIYCC